MDEPSRLVISWEFDEPDYGRLTCSAAHDGFSGRAKQWIGRENLFQFAEALDAYPLSADDPPTLGQEVDQLPSAIQMAVRPTSPTGGLTVFVRLTRDPGFEPRQDVSLAIPTEYGLLPRFASDIRRMLHAGSGEAVLGADVPG